MVEGRHDFSAEGEEVEFFGGAVQDFASGCDEQGVGKAALPIGIEGLEHFVFVGIGEVEVAGGGVVLLEEAEDFVFFVGILGGDGDEFEIAVTKPEVGFDEGIEFGNARAAPGGPDIDQANFSGFVRTQVAQNLGGGWCEGDGFFADFFQPAGVRFRFGVPLGGTAEDFSLGYIRLAAGEESVERGACVASFDEVLAFVVIDAALVTELAIGIEDKDVRGGDGAELFGERFGRAVIEVREIELLVGGTNFHRFEGIIEVGVAEFIEADGGGAVWIDGDDGDAAGFVIGGERFNAFLVSLGGRTMIAGENDGEEFGVREIFRGVGATVDAR